MKFSASERHSTAAEQHSTAAEQTSAAVDQTSAAAEQTSAAAAKNQQQPNKINSSGLTTASGDEILLGPVRPIRAWRWLPRKTFEEPSRDLQPA